MTPEIDWDAEFAGFGEEIDLAIVSGLGFRPGTLDVNAMIEAVNELFQGRVFLELSEPNAHGWRNGLCPHPEHDDHTPSFGIDLRTGACKCFRCGAWKFGELLMILDATYSPMDQRLFPTQASVREWYKRFEIGGDPNDPLARLMAGGNSTLMAMSFAPDIERAELGMAYWAHNTRASDYEGVEAALQEFDRLRFSDEEAACVYFRRVAKTGVSA